jgi:hypothetical protein
MAGETMQEAIDFQFRQPSQNWETVLLPTGESMWVWFRPATAPHGLTIRLPEQPQRFTLQQLLQAAGVAVQTVAAWNLHGQSFQVATHGGLLMQPCPVSPTGSDLQLHVWTQAVEVPPTPSPSTAVATDDRSTRQILDTIDADWQAALQIESQMLLVRKQLGNMINRLNTLNRDLNPDERRYADRQDISDWQDARRWLRDVASRVARCIKEHDIGQASMAGRREWFEITFQTKVALRQPFDGIHEVQREFESYRRLVQTQMVGMKAALATASQDGERRAQQLLTRIATKVRSSKR